MTLMMDPSFFDNAVLLASLLAEQDSKLMFLAMGIGTFAGGVLLLLSHKRSVDEAFGNPVRSDAFKRMEYRKYRRRSATSAMIAIIGALITGCYFVTDGRVALAFSLAIVVLVMIVGTLAIVDFFSVGLQQIVASNRESEKAILEEIVRQHHKAKEKSEAEQQANPEE